MLTVGKWNTLYFVQSEVELDYIKEQLKHTVDTDDAKLDLNADDEVSGILD